MLINLNIGNFYKVESKMNARDFSGEERIFEKKDYAFSIQTINFADNNVSVNYQGKIYNFDLSHARHNFRPALTSKDIEQYVVLKYLTGSHAYGTNIETSDMDYKAVFVMPDWMYAKMDFNPDWEEIREKDESVGSEITYYSLRKFMLLLAVNNPNILEVFDIPEGCLRYSDSCMDRLLSSSDLILSKLSYKAFLGYGESQIRKADGQDKMGNWEKEKMVRKSPMDFCYTFFGQGSKPLSDWLSENGMFQKFCTLNTIMHMRDIYGLYYDYAAHVLEVVKAAVAGTIDKRFIRDNVICYEYLRDLNRGGFPSQMAEQPETTLEWLEKHGVKPIGYQGIIADKSNDIRKMETPKEAKPVIYISYNKDGYSSHCKLYKRYQTWIKERNTARWVDVENHGQKIDGKNMMHCIRLIYMAEDIAKGRGIVVRRPEAEYLISIRKGKLDLDTLMTQAEGKMKELKPLFEHSGLINEPDISKLYEIYETIKSEFLKN